MDDLVRYRDIIERILSEHASIPYTFGQLEHQLVFDRARDHYLLLSVGWQKKRRVHGVLVHLDLIDGKVWIQRDGIEYGIAQDLLDAGIPKEHIVLGFKSPELRKYTDFAIA